MDICTPAIFSVMERWSETTGPRRIAFVSCGARRTDPDIPVVGGLARSLGASLVVLGSLAEVPSLTTAPPMLVVKRRSRRPPGLPRTTERDRALCALLPCPVLLYAGDLSTRSTTLAAVALHDDRPAALDRAVVLWARAVAGWRGGPLHVVHAWSPVGESILSCPTRGVGRQRGARLLVRTRRELGARMDTLLASCGLGPDVPRTLGHGVPSRVISVVAARTHADLLVIGHRCRSWLGRLPGQPLAAAWRAPGLSLLAVDAASVQSDAPPLTPSPRSAP